MKRVRTLVWIVGVVCGGVHVVFAESPQTIDVWLDVDPANGVGEVDDGLMMIQVFHSPALTVHGVSVVYGNTELARGLPIARDIVSRFGPPGLSVFGGAASSAEFGKENEATRALAAALQRHPLTLLAVGPVTNVGTLIKLHPELHGRIQRILMVAGRRPHQRFFVSPRTLADFNFEHDPDAMQAILDTSIPLMFAPWEVSSKVWITRSDLAALATTGPSGAWIAETCTDWIKHWEERIGPWGFNPFDTLAAGWLSHPKLIETMRVNAHIEMGRDDGAQPVGREAGEPKPYLFVTRASPADREILYAVRPDPRFKGVLLRRLAGPTYRAIPHAAKLAQAAARFDHTVFDALLHKYVDERGGVNYANLRSDADALDAYLAALAEADLSPLGRDEQLAFLINAYNAFTLRIILDYYPIRSIKDIPSEERWKARRWRLGGRTFSLNQIEHEQIRPKFAEPRVHFALVCAAVGCPPLRAEAYTGARLEPQLADQTRYIHAHDRWFRFEDRHSVVHLTKLYNWYGDDFKLGAGAVLTYAARYSARLAGALAAQRDIHVEWIDYDWRLNNPAGVRMFHERIRRAHRSE